MSTVAPSCALLPALPEPLPRATTRNCCALLFIAVTLLFIDVHCPAVLCCAVLCCAVLQAPDTVKYKSTIQYPRPSEGVLEVDASFLWVQVGDGHI
jgi:hypothetical protein